MRGKAYCDKICPGCGRIVEPWGLHPDCLGITASLNSILSKVFKSEIGTDELKLMPRAKAIAESAEAALLKVGVVAVNAHRRDDIKSVFLEAMTRACVLMSLSKTDFALDLSVQPSALIQNGRPELVDQVSRGGRIHTDVATSSVGMSRVHPALDKRLEGNNRGDAINTNGRSRGAVQLRRASPRPVAKRRRGSSLDRWASLHSRHA